MYLCTTSIFAQFGTWWVVAVLFNLTSTIIMPAIRTKDDDEYISQQGGYKPGHNTSSAALRPRRKANLSTAIVDCLPFPEGAPTEPVHYAILQFSTVPVLALDLGTIDNLLLFLYFSTKHNKSHIWSLHIATFPARYDLTQDLKRKPCLAFHNLRHALVGTPYDQWVAMTKKAIEDVFIITRDNGLPVTRDMEQVLNSEIFHQ
jgi:hypothetical protein